MSDIEIAQLPYADLESMDRACGGDYVVMAPSEDQASSWSSEVSALIGDNAPLLKEQLMNEFGIANFYQGPGGEVFIVPHDNSKPCVEIQPGGVS